MGVRLVELSGSTISECQVEIDQIGDLEKTIPVWFNHVQNTVPCHLTRLPELPRNRDLLIHSNRKGQWTPN